MKDHQTIPNSLQIVAGLFLLYGISSAIGMVVFYATRNGIKLDFGFLGIFAFFGLRRFSAGWRIFTLICTWIGLIILPIMFALSFVGYGSTYFNVFGMRISQIPSFWFPVVCLILFIAELWQYRVLIRPDIRALFYPSEL